MGNFAFIVHPIDLDNVFSKLRFLRRWPTPLSETIMRNLPPFKVSGITGVSSSHADISGFIIACPLTSKQMVNLPQDKVINKIIRTGMAAEKLGAKIVGLGAMTSVIGDAGITVAKNLNIAVTTGGSYTVAIALEAARKAAEVMDMDLGRAEVLIVGATSSIGSVCARILARDVRFLTLLARNKRKLEHLTTRILRENGLAVRVSSDVKNSVSRADIIITVTGPAEEVIDVADLKPGAVICDVIRPRDISRRAAQLRNDVLVIEGGVVAVPGKPDFGLDFGFPPGMVSAGMAETMILALEERLESFSLGRELSVAQIDNITSLAEKHGFKLGGFRSFEGVFTTQHIDAVRRNAGIKQGKL
jgi:fatty aldehyde-generating acyl-ACP reductase